MSEWENLITVCGINLITSEFYIEDRISKMRWYSNPEKWNTDGGASGSNLEMLGSQVVVDYYSDKNESGTMSSYKDAFQKGQIMQATIHFTRWGP